MSNSNNKGNNIMIPNARQAMDQFKMEAASQVGVNLKQGYNGDLTSREAGSVGGQMVKHICPVRTVVINRANRNVDKHIIPITYQYSLVL